jgi:hypothetical protein
MQYSLQMSKTVCVWIIRELAKLRLRGEGQGQSAQRLKLTVSANDVYIQ